MHRTMQICVNIVIPLRYNPVAGSNGPKSPSITHTASQTDRVHRTGRDVLDFFFLLFLLHLERAFHCREAKEALSKKKVQPFMHFYLTVQMWPTFEGILARYLVQF